MFSLKNAYVWRLAVWPSYMSKNDLRKEGRVEAAALCGEVRFPSLNYSPGGHQALLAKRIQPESTIGRVWHEVREVGRIQSNFTIVEKIEQFTV